RLLENARDDSGSAAKGRCQHQARYLCDDERIAALHRRGDSAARDDHAGQPHPAVRASRGRQSALQPERACRRKCRRIPHARPADPSRDACTRSAIRRQLQRRARNRPTEARRARPLQTSGRARDHALHQAGARSERHHEPRQGSISAHSGTLPIGNTFVDLHESGRMADSASFTYRLLCRGWVAIAVFFVASSYAQEVTERVLDDEGNPRVVEQQWSHVGLLRARDLTPFGLLRLDMLPAHTADAEAGTWTFEIQYAYQNTFILSP